MKFKDKILENKTLRKIFIKLKLMFFLLRLLFSNNNKTRFLIFDTMHLKQFFDQDNWQEILKNHPKNKVINNARNSEETAVLIPGRLRCWDKSKDLIYSIAEKNKVFIVTDESDSKIINDINHKNIFITNVDNSTYKSQLSKISNVSLNQYFKLKCAIEEVYKYEKNNSFFFKNFIKIRSDFYYYNSENLLDMTKENNEDYLFAQSDLHFSGRREFFLPLRNFYDFSEWSYNNDFHNLEFMPINPTQIIKSDPGATKFAFLKFPEDVVETLDRRPTSEYIHEKVNKNYKKALKYTYKANDKFKLTGSPDYVATEQSFAWFLNLLGTPCKTHLKYAGFIMHNPGKVVKDGLKEGVTKYQKDMENIRNKKI